MTKDLKILVVAGITCVLGGGMFKAVSDLKNTIAIKTDDIHARIEKAERHIYDVQYEQVKKTSEINKNMSELLVFYSLDKRAVEDRVISNLKKDYECPNEYFKDVCFTLNKYHRIY